MRERRAARALAWAAFLSIGVVVAAVIRARPGLPPPTGAYNVGTVSFTLHDDAPGATQGAPFTVRMWYPAGGSGSAAAPYRSDSTGLHALYDRTIRTHAREDAPPAAAGSPFSVLVYAPGWGGRRTDNTALCEELASHGFVVAALDDLLRAPADAPGWQGELDFSSARAYETTLEVGRRKARLASKRVSRILDHLAELNAEPAGRFYGKLQTRETGAFGFSFGGNVAAQSCRDDARCKAVLNLDGWVFGDVAAHGTGRPYFVVSDDEPMPTQSDFVSNDPQRKYMADLTMRGDRSQNASFSQNGGYLLRIAGTRHSIFTDAPLYSLRRALAFPTGLAPQRVTAIVRAYTVAFFASELRHASEPLLRPGQVRDPEITFTVWTGRGEALGKQTAAAL